MERIAATWQRKGIRQKMHYSEPCPDAVTLLGTGGCRHSPRVTTLPPCSPDMDLMIEAKDKEQAVFELMRDFKLPGFEKINDVIPFVREDEDRPQSGPKSGARDPAGLKRKRGKSRAEPEQRGDQRGVRGHGTRKPRRTR